MTGAVPTEAFVVRTQNSTYRFGPADKDGARTVSRDGKALEFTRCKLSHIEVGKEMTLRCYDAPRSKSWLDRNFWCTTTVVAIEQVH